MTKTEADRFRAILTAKVADWNTSSEGAIASRLSEAPISWKRPRRLRNVHSRFVTSTVTLINFGTLARPSVVPKEAASVYARSVMTTLPGSGSSRCRGSILYTVPGSCRPQSQEIQAPSGDLLGRAA